MSEETRKGRQTPTVSVVLAYEQSKGAEALEIYDRSKRQSMPWQQLMMEDIMAVNEDGLWTHMKFGYSVPRRNGKSEILMMRVVYAIINGERALYTAHRTTTSHNAWEKCIERLTKAGFKEGDDFKTTKQFGLEHIEWLKGEGVINFRTRSSKGGLGEGYDLLIIDEAQEYTSDQESALKYVVTDSSNPQTLMCGTPPTVVSAGTVFQSYRRNVLTGKSEDCGWAEWSVPNLTDARNPEVWYETNPSLGYILSERTIRSELGEVDEQVDVNIQRLGLWIKYNQKSAINQDEWESFTKKEVTLAPNAKLYFGVKYSKITSNVSLSVAVKTAQGSVFVEAIDCRNVREGNDWIIDFLRSKKASKVVIDGAGNQHILADDMKNASVKCKAILPKVSEVIEANALFEKKLFGGQIVHAGQPSLVQAVANCEHRAIGSGGGFGYSSMLEGADVGLLESVSLAHWACCNAKEGKKQIVQY